MTPVRVAVIGAGAAGLVAAHELRLEGHEVTVFEQSDRVGGLWNYTDEVEDDPLGQRPSRRIHTSLYESLEVNLPRDLMAFEGRPDPVSHYRGEARTGWLGVDARAGRWVAGLAVSHGASGSDYGFAGGEAADERGRLETTLTTFYPYGRWTLGNGLELRGLATSSSRLPETANCGQDRASCRPARRRRHRRHHHLPVELTGEVLNDGRGARGQDSRCIPPRFVAPRLPAVRHAPSSRRASRAPPRSRCHADFFHGLLKLRL